MATRDAMTAGDAVYARYSSELQNPRSCDDQITELRQALERRGGSFDGRLVFSDSEVSGGIWERDGLQALLLAVESGRVRRIFVEDLSRLSRDKEDAARIEKLLAYSEVSVVTLDGMVYDGSTGSALAFTFQSAGAAQYLKDLGAKTRRGLRGSHRDGKSTGGRCFGFEVEALKLKVNEAGLHEPPERARDAGAATSARGDWRRHCLPGRGCPYSAPPGGASRLFLTGRRS